MSKYISFNRKYRPSELNELVGQDVLVKIISSSIIEDRINQVYLLTGIRGVGKTSSARIIAKTFSCSEKQINQRQISTCNKCENCISFKNNNHPDIIEMDAASHTSVDDVRNIIEQCEYKPLISKYKFFIIDEVHMLSKSAFNALLKIIEEPPSHIIFIFATTEYQKIPQTIISRCQKYSLNRLNIDQISSLLTDISQKENIDITTTAIKQIAILSEGSAREAISLLDQTINYYNNNLSSLKQTKQINESLIMQMVGVVTTEVMINLTSYIAQNKLEEAIKLIDDLYHKSYDLFLFFEHYANFIAEISKIKLLKNYTHPIYSNFTEEINQLTNIYDVTNLTNIWQIISKELEHMKNANNILLSSQMLIIKLMHAVEIANDIFSINTKNIQQQNIQQSTNIVNNINEIDEKDNSNIKIENHNIKSQITAQSTPDKKIDLINFLKFCKKENQMALIYFLMNECEILNFSSELFEITTNNQEKNLEQIKDYIRQFVTKYSNHANINIAENYKIKITRANNINNLKDKLKASANDNFLQQRLKKQLQASEIIDILLK